MAWSTPRSRRDGLGDLRRVERADEREEPAGGIGEPGDRTARSAVGPSLTVYTVPDVPIEIGDVAGPQPDTERGGHVVAGARRDNGAAPRPRPLERTEDLGHDGRPVAVGVDDAEQVEPVRARSRATSSRCPRRRHDR